ncbi:MAG: ATP-binding cassette domain-containing protein [Acidimicrobiia bacterium]|nr:ATP-binding cassette domain-containing protein [Acidimicrobiia bacterium]
MSQPTLEVADLRVRYPQRRQPALENVDLRVGEGERVLVVGSSGTGKSTLLRALCGVVPQSIHADVSGRIRVDGRDPLEEPVAEVAHSVGYLGQDPATQVSPHCRGRRCNGFGEPRRPPRGNWATGDGGAGGERGGASR